LDQNRTPILEALNSVKSMRIVPFDVPGHKRGRGNPELAAFLGEKCMNVDVNSMKPLDNLCHPVSVIREAEELAAAAFGAAHAFFMVNGTTSACQAMIMTACKSGDEIILPRNVHISVINALILCGATPVYVNPRTDNRLGISLGMSCSDVEKAILEHGGAKAVLLNNPTYYGICSNVKRITDAAHARGMMVLADEAHGTHFYFGEDMPTSAMAAGADMASVSMHKSGGSLTQSSLLLTGPRVNAHYVRQIVNLTQTTSGSYLLLSSLDISRKYLAQNGKEIFRRVGEMAQYARDEINRIGDYYAYSKELVNGDTIFNFDTTKLSVNTLGLGLAGIEVYDILRDEYDIQVEFGDIGNILAYISVGDTVKNIERLVSALSDIRRLYKKDRSGMLAYEYISPTVVVTPQNAFYADKKSVPLKDALGGICAENVMSYPPGIRSCLPESGLRGNH
jgi:arginine/lysine/ornithine decarboxylase